MNEFFGVPRLPRHLVSRRRLSDQLDEAHGFAIVHGPSGAGKTVAVTDWASRSDPSASGAWCTVDEGTTTRLAFWSALAEVLVDAQFHPAAATLSHELSSLEADDDPRRIVLRATAQMTRHFTIVLDDFWRVTDPAVADDLLAMVRANPKLSVVVITRSLGQAISREDEIALAPVIVGPEALAFTEAEIIEMLDLAAVTDEQEDIAQTLVRVVDGQALLIRGVIQAISRGDQSFAPGSLRSTVSHLGAQLVKELVLPQTLTARDEAAVLACAVPEALTVDLVHELTEADGHELLERFEREGLGVWLGEQTEAEFLLAPLVRTAWQTELRAKYSQRVPALSLATAEWSIRHQRPLAALRHALDAQAYDLATDIIIRSWTDLMRTQRSVVLELLDGLPVRVLSAQPVLAMWLALAHNAIGLHRARAFELLTMISQTVGLAREGAPPTRQAIFYLIESTAFRVLGKSEPALEAADRARELIEQLNDDEKHELGTFLPMLLNNAGIAYLYAAHFAQASDMFEAALASDVLSREGGAYHSRSLLAGLHAICGEMRKAAAAARGIAQDDWPAQLRTSYLGALLQVAEAHLALERFEFEAALSCVEAMAAHADTIEHWPLFAEIEAYALLGLGEVHAAIRGLEARALSPTRPTTPEFQTRLDATRALLHLTAGQLAKAEALLEQHPRTHAQVAICRARLELLRAQPEAAIEALFAAQPADQMSVRLTSEAHLLRAAATLRLGRTEAALASMDSAVAQMTGHGLRSAVLLLSRNDRDALVAALDARGQSRASEFMHSLNEQPSLMPDEVTVIALSDREMVVLRALAAGESLAAIAEGLFVSKNTVKSQTQSLYRKLGVSTRSEAVVRAAELHLLD